MFNYIKYLKDDFSTKKNQLYSIIEDLQKLNKSQTVKNILRNLKHFSKKLKI